MARAPSAVRRAGAAPAHASAHAASVTPSWKRHGREKREARQWRLEAADSEEALEAVPRMLSTPRETHLPRLEVAGTGEKLQAVPKAQSAPRVRASGDATGDSAPLAASLVRRRMHEAGNSARLADGPAPSGARQAEYLSDQRARQPKPSSSERAQQPERSPNGRAGQPEASVLAGLTLPFHSAEGKEAPRKDKGVPLKRPLVHEEAMVSDGLALQFPNQPIHGPQPVFPPAAAGAGPRGGADEQDGLRWGRLTGELPAGLRSACKVAPRARTINWASLPFPVTPLRPPGPLSAFQADAAAPLSPIATPEKVFSTSLHLPVYLPIYLLVYPSIHPSVNPSLHLLACQLFHLSIQRQ